MKVSLPGSPRRQVETRITYHTLALLHVDLVAQNDKGEIVRVPGRSLHQELVAPALDGFEALGVVDIKDKDAAVGAAVEGNT